MCWAVSVGILDYSSRRKISSSLTDEGDLGTKCTLCAKLHPIRVLWTVNPVFFGRHGRQTCLIKTRICLVTFKGKLSFWKTGISWVKCLHRWVVNVVSYFFVITQLHRAIMDSNDGSPIDGCQYNYRYNGIKTSFGFFQIWSPGKKVKMIHQPSHFPYNWLRWISSSSKLFCYLYFTFN